MKIISISFILLLFCFTITAQQKNKKTEIFKVLGTCIQCKERIEKTVLEFGAYKAEWVIATNMLTVQFDSMLFSKAAFQMQLAKIGHDNEAFQTDDKTYFSLPKCCYYIRFSLQATEKQPDTIGSNIQKITLQMITGVVLEESKKGKLTPLVGASVRVINKDLGTNTDSMGVFQIKADLPVQLEISFIGFKKDTITIHSYTTLKVILKNPYKTLFKEVIIKARNPSAYVSSQSTLNTLLIGTKELAKAACCNLSESFETSPSIDVSYTDAVTGIKQLQLLGLAGNYLQLLTENTPEIKGLSGSFGLNFIPGPWIESIQLTKGTGSVVNGYESISGQINIEEKKPDKMEKMFINAYGNSMGRMELSVNHAININDKWSTALLNHINGVATKTDANKDGYLDIPLGRQFNFINRWRYVDNNGLIMQFSIKALNDRRQSGAVNFNSKKDKFTTNNYGVGSDMQQYSFTGKAGYIYPKEKYKSIGLIFSANQFKNNAFYGLTDYQSRQKGFYFNVIYQSIIGTTANKFRTGISLNNDHISEIFKSNPYNRIENVPGVFFEHTFTGLNKFTAITGLRLDLHNQYGFKFTPRFHAKYDFSPKTNLRIVFGSGWKVANIFAENTGLFVSARQYEISDNNTNYGYGLSPEKAWNYGLNFIHQFKVNNRPGTISIDLYSTKFEQQVVVDIDADTKKILFYNLNGKSFSKSMQTELNYELIPKLDIRLAYRWLELFTNYKTGLLEKPLIAKHRAFLNFAYETKNKWKFDWTVQWISKKRLPNTSVNPPEFQIGKYSPDFIQMNAQITKLFKNKWELYFGTENLTNYTQKNLFVNGQQPFGNYFDGALVWGPVNGIIIYTGFRFQLK